MRKRQRYPSRVVIQISSSGRRGDYLLVSLGPSRFELATGPTHYSLELQDGEMQVLKGGWAHEIINKFGVRALGDFAKLHFRTAYEVVKEAGKLGELPLPEPKDKIEWR